MSDISDIEDLLRKARKHAARLMWAKTAIVGACALFGSCVGAAKSAVALSILVRQVATKDDIASLEKQYARISADSFEHERIQDARIASLEPRCSDALQCCNTQSQRLDRFSIPGRVGR